jgi:hypothetical protein
MLGYFDSVPCAFGEADCGGLSLNRVIFLFCSQGFRTPDFV